MGRKANIIEKSNVGIAAVIILPEIVQSQQRRKVTRKEKVNVKFRDYDDDDYCDRVILSCFENHCPEYFQNDAANENLKL